VPTLPDAAAGPDRLTENSYRLQKINVCYEITLEAEQKFRPAGIPENEYSPLWNVNVAAELGQ
jgi:hypothetical protein